MTAIVFTIALLTIIAIARYNKSVSLFFILLTMMLGGFAGGALANRYIDSDADDTNSTQVQPMQSNPESIGLFALVDVRDVLDPSGSAGKAETPACDVEYSIAPSKGIVLDVPVNPPQEVEIVDDS